MNWLAKWLESTKLTGNELAVETTRLCAISWRIADADKDVADERRVCDKRVAAIESEKTAIQITCPHPVTTYSGDASDVMKTYSTCDVCGVELSKHGAWVAALKASAT